MEFNKEEIINRKKVLNKDFCCIYFLIKNDEIVYVGQSTRGIRRIYEHTDKDFDYYNIIQVERKELDTVETEAIIEFKPFYNKSIPLGSNLYIAKSKINKEYKISPSGLKAIVEKYDIKPQYNNNFKREIISFNIKKGLEDKVLLKKDFVNSTDYEFKKYPKSKKAVGENE